MREIYTDQMLADTLKWFKDRLVESDEDREDFAKLCKYVGQYGLWYEVFEIARSNLSPTSSKQAVLQALDYQMGEWDL